MSVPDNFADAVSELRQIMLNGKEEYAQLWDARNLMFLSSSQLQLSKLNKYYMVRG